MTGTEVEGKIFLLNLHISSTSSGLSAIVPRQKKIQSNKQDNQSRHVK